MSTRNLEDLVDANHNAFNSRIAEMEMHLVRYRAVLLCMRNLFKENQLIMDVLAPALAVNAGQELLDVIYSVVKEEEGALTKLKTLIARPLEG
jgi:hypothetical protein